MPTVPPLTARLPRSGILALLLVLAFFGCRNIGTDDDGKADENLVIASNGLPDELRGAFYHLPEGGNFIPYRAFRALEQPNSRKLFRENLNRFGFIPDGRSADNPDALPVGMALEEAPDLHTTIVGVNCAACHVGEIRYGDARYRIEGAPNLLDFTAFNLEFVESVQATMERPEKLFRFIRRYLENGEGGRGIYSGIQSHAGMSQSGDSLEADLFRTIQERVQAEARIYDALNPVKAHHRARRALFGEAGKAPAKNGNASALPASIDDPPMEDGYLAGLDEAHQKEEALKGLTSIERDFGLLLARMHLLRMALKNANVPTSEPGPGRFDAFSMVRNLSFGEYGASPMTAPTSISHLWGLGEHAWYHYLGMTTTVVGRNIAAIDYIVSRDYETTLLLDNIRDLEAMYRTLETPAWRDVLPPLDADRVGRGREIYQGSTARYRDTRRGNCASCHDGAKPFEADPRFLVYPSFTPEELGVDPNLMRTFTTPLKEGLTLAQAISDQVDGIESRFRRDRGMTRETYREQYEFGRNILVWKDSHVHAARPLHGIWASPPYLHNGSVPSLADLLRPAEDRPTTFALGHRQYDPVRVGYTTHPRKVAWVFDTRRPVADPDGRVYPDLTNGNSNRGHEFGVDLTDEERLDLIEYLKTL